MAKREYIEANKEWLAAKAKEDGVKALHMAAQRYSIQSLNMAPTGIFR